jgi:hypothetical protein
MKEGQKTSFKGFGIRNATYEITRFVCQSCTNHCEIRRVRIAGEKKSLFYGGRCEKYETDGRKKVANNIPNLYQKRIEMLMDGFTEGEVKSGTYGLLPAIPLLAHFFPAARIQCSPFQGVGQSTCNTVN